MSFDRPKKIIVNLVYSLIKRKILHSQVLYVKSLPPNQVLNDFNNEAEPEPSVTG